MFGIEEAHPINLPYGFYDKECWLYSGRVFLPPSKNNRSGQIKFDVIVPEKRLIDNLEQTISNTGGWNIIEPLPAENWCASREKQQ